MNVQGLRGYEREGIGNRLFKESVEIVVELKALRRLEAGVVADILRQKLDSSNCWVTHLDLFFSHHLEIRIIHVEEVLAIIEVDAQCLQIEGRIVEVALPSELVEVDRVGGVELEQRNIVHEDELLVLVEVDVIGCDKQSELRLVVPGAGE